jgi:hypothetical protein
MAGSNREWYGGGYAGPEPHLASTEDPVDFARFRRISMCQHTICMDMSRVKPGSARWVQSNMRTSLNAH